MREEITISLDEYTELSISLWRALVIKGVLYTEDKTKYTEIVSGLAFMFTEEYGEYQQKKKGEKNG